MDSFSMKTFAILIDAGFVRAKLGSAKKPVSAQSIQRLVSAICSHEQLQSMDLYRVYYYDAPPFFKNKMKPLGGGLHSFVEDPLYRHNQKMLEELKTAANFALRMGELVFRGWEIDQKMLKSQQPEILVTADDLRPSLKQKGVDMRIGLDIASLALKKQVDMLVLVAGDSDFVPPMKFARREGLQFAIVTLGHEVRTELLEHADYSLSVK